MLDLSVLLAFATSWLWIALPLNAAVSIWRRRRNQPGESCRFAYFVLLAWGLSAIAFVLFLISGYWYGENSPPPSGADVLGALLAFIVLAALHVALGILGQPLPADRRSL